jgi:ATP-binding cassette subfamily F protein uup
MAAAPLILSVKDAVVKYTEKPLFQDMNFNIHQGSRIALVGRNGSGKTTLMNIILGNKELDGGERWQEIGLTIGYLKQDITPKKGESVFDFIFEEIPDDENKEFYAYKVDVICEALDLDKTAMMTHLSGGQIRRAGLARSLVEEPDLLMLDEPTNHLDLEAIQWLEDYLTNYRGTLLCISHDKTFLGNITNKVFWLDRGQIRVAPSGFADFDDWSTMLLEQEERELRNRSKIVEREVEWASKGVKARRKRNERRVIEMREMRDKLKSDKSAYIRVVSKIKMPEPTTDEKSSKIVAEYYNVHKSFKKENGDDLIILDKFNMRIMRGDRIGILGKNGSGKTTFLKMLLQESTPDSGRVKVRKELEFSYFDQKRSDLMLDETPWKNLCPTGGDHVNVMGKERHVVAYLKDFMFDPEDVRQPARTLSGGQKNRLMLAKTLANPKTCLVLDEPTNDLDMETLDMLEEILAKYKGTLIIVSHDRDFLDQTVTKILAFEGNGVVDGCIGGYSDYLAYKNSLKQEPVETQKTIKKQTAKETPSATKTENKLSYKYQHELEKLPKRIEKLETEITEMTTKLSDPDLYQKDKDQFFHLTKQLKAKQTSLESAESRWLELEEMKQNIE